MHELFHPGCLCRDRKWVVSSSRGNDESSHGCTTPFCLTHQHKPLDPEPRVTVRLALLVRSSSPVGGLGEGALCLPFLLQYFRSPRPSTTSLLRPSLVYYDLHLFP